jgi:hypothetical protein
MALVSRTVRRSSARRWVILGVVATVIVLLIDVAISDRSRGPGRQLADQSWLDEAEPLITQSTQDGQAIVAIRTEALKLPGLVIASRLNQVAASTDQTLSKLRRLIAPTELATSASMLLATMAVRSVTAHDLAKAMTAALADRPVTLPSPTPSATGQPTTVTESALAALTQVGHDISLGDRSYQLFEQYLPADVATNPRPLPSIWLTDPAAYQPAQLRLFVAGLQSAASLTPVHSVGVLVVTTNPAPLSLSGPQEMLPATHSLSLQVVVANTGNQDERDLTVSATISPARYSPTQMARGFVNLAPGASQTVQLGGFVPRTNVPFTLSVGITAVKGQTDVSNNTRTLSLIVE